MDSNNRAKTSYDYKTRKACRDACRDIHKSPYYNFHSGETKCKCAKPTLQWDDVIKDNKGRISDTKCDGCDSGNSWCTLPIGCLNTCGAGATRAAQASIPRSHAACTFERLLPTPTRSLFPCRIWCPKIQSLILPLSNLSFNSLLLCIHPPLCIILAHSHQSLACFPPLPDSSAITEGQGGYHGDFQGGGNALLVAA